MNKKLNFHKKNPTTHKKVKIVNISKIIYLLVMSNTQMTITKY